MYDMARAIVIPRAMCQLGFFSVKEVYVEMSRVKKGRKWAYTLFWENDEQKDAYLERLKSLATKVHICGQEVCPKTKRDHLQGYLELIDPVAFQYWKNQFPRLHVEPPREDLDVNAIYCRKDGNMLIDQGYVRKEGTVVYDCPPGRKNRESMQVIDKINRGASFWQIREEHPWFTFWYRRNILEYKRDLKFKTETSGDVDPEY